jgi:hypothetical protein
MAKALAGAGAVHRVGVRSKFAKACPPYFTSPRLREEVKEAAVAFRTNILSADLDRPYPPAVARVHAVIDDVAAVIIIIRIVVVIGEGSKTESQEAMPMKSAGEATMEPATVEPATVEAATVEAAAVEAAASKATVTAASAAMTTSAAAMSKCRCRLNQADSRQCEQSHYPFAYHVCLHDLKSPTKHETPSQLEYSTTKKPDG